MLTAGQALQARVCGDSGLDRDAGGDLLAVVGSRGRGDGVEQLAVVGGAQQLRAVVGVAGRGGSGGGDGRGRDPGPGPGPAVPVGEDDVLVRRDGAGPVSYTHL